MATRTRPFAVIRSIRKSPRQCPVSKYSQHRVTAARTTPFSKAVAHSLTAHPEFKEVFDALRELLTPPDPPKRPIGFVNLKDKGKKTSATRAKT